MKKTSDHMHRPDHSAQRQRRLNRTHWGRMVAVVVCVIIVAAALTTWTNSSVTPMASETRSSGSLPQLKFTKNGELTFISAKNSFLVAIDIEIADTPEKRSLGMMYRNVLGERQGMLFVFPKEDVQSFWMKNTAVPLDMIFVSARNEIVTIHENTTPYSPQSYSSTKPAQFVVEVNAGFARKYGIAVGDRIRWK